jgi:hypothetical protein
MSMRCGSLSANKNCPVVSTAPAKTGKVSILESKLSPLPGNLLFQPK